MNYFLINGDFKILSAMSLSASNPSMNPKRSTLTQSCHKFMSTISVELAVFCFTFAITMSALTHQNLNLEKACRVNLNFSQHVCDSLTSRNLSGFEKTQEVAVQQLVAEAYAWNNALVNVLPTILLVVLGSWSDRNQRRKIIILLPLMGQILSSIGLIISTYFFYEIPMRVNIFIDVLPSSATGSLSLLFAGAFSYISQYTAEDKKTLRIGVVHIIIAISLTAATALSGVLYYWIGFYGVFSLSTILFLLGLTHGFYFIHEKPINDHKKNVFIDIFNVKATLTSYKFIKKKDNSKQMKQLLLLTFVAVLNFGQTMGENAVLYLYTRYKFNWNEVDFSVFFTYYSFSHFLATAFALYVFSKCLKIQDSLLGAISVINRILGGIVYTFASSVALLYIATTIEVLRNLAFIASRSIISKIISPNEIGKANSIFGIAESVAVLIYVPLYSALYNATISIFPESFFVFGIVCSIPAVTIYLWIYFYEKRNITKEEFELIEENQENTLKTNGQLMNTE